MKNPQKKVSLTSKEFNIDAEIDAEIPLSEYIQEVKPSKQTLNKIGVWADKEREKTRTRLALGLVKIFAFSLGASFTLIGVATFIPKSDKALLKEILPSIINAQVVLLGVGLGFYFGNKDE